MKRTLIFALLAALTPAHADPQLTSWFTANSGKYARIYQSTANETTGITASLTTWSRGTGTQTNPAYADINEINHSASWVYIRSTGLASHIMGPWYLDAAKTQNFPNFPSNTSVLYRIPRTPVIPGTKTLTGLGATGRMVNGVSMFDSRDAFSYSNANAGDATPGGSFTGDGIWNRDGYFNEGVTFDPGLAHQAGNNYHYHAHPIALRYQLGDHVDYNAATNRYTESAAAVTQHSPIVAWAADGLPVYGPYGYSSPLNAASGVRRMISGFTKRDGTNGTTAITVRQVLPLWASRVQGRVDGNGAPIALTALQYGPAVNTTYAVGRYIEDFDYRGDLAGQTLGTDFDLNEQNVRFCVTPEFPAGTWAYFTPINADGTPQFPYTTGRAYYGNPTGGASTAAVMNADAPLTQQFIGGANKALTISAPAVSGTTVTLTWSAVEGGTYSVDASSVSNFSPFTNKASGLVSTGISKNTSYTALGTSGTEYGRVNRTALATYDSAGQTAATVSQTTSTSYSLTPNDPPTITGISAVTVQKNNATSAISFTVGDTETAAASLTVSATSSNTALVPNANITFGGSGTSRTVTVTPASGQVGTATITVTVSDGTNTTSTTFTLTVKPPNILLIIADDLGIDALSAYSSLLGNSGTGQFPPTPAIASLAANGVQFNRAYTYTVCSPSRACILTGRFGYRTGVGNVVAGTSNNFLQATEFTLPRAFAANASLNFQLKHIGKWHLTALTGANANLGPCVIGGWPAFTGSLAGQLADFYSWTKIISDGTAGGTSSSTSTTYETTDIVNDAISFITTQNTAGKPWFTTVAFNAPHITQATPWYQLPPTGLLTAPYNALSGTSADILANPRNYFDATIQAMDTEMARLLASVDLTKTNVIFIGDNGTFGTNAANSGSVIQSPFSANKAKATLYEGGIRVPLIIRGPDVVSPGRTTDALTHAVDLYSTILEMAGINVAGTVATAGAVIDSHSLLPVLQNTASAQSVLIYGEEFDIASPALGGRCLRDSQYKLIRKATGVNTTTDEFYDLTADPYEATNLIPGGTGSLTAPQLTAYNNLVTQLATFNTAPTISAIADQSTQPGTATGAIAFTVGDAELAATSLTVTAASSNITLVPSANVVLGGSGASRNVTITPATGLTGTSTITLSVSDGAFTTSTSFVLTVAVSGPPTITTIATSPAVPTNTDTVTVTANVQPLGGRTLPAGNVVLTYTAGSSVQSTVFTETMGTSAGAWTTAANLGANNAWTVNFAAGPPNPFSQTTAANHGSGNAYGLEMNRGTPNLTDNYVTTTNAINATGTSAYVEFYVATANLINSGGWTFQTSTDGATWTTRLSETTANNHTYPASPYHYDFIAGERVSTLKLRFQFAGAGAANPASKMSLDDIKVLTTNTPVPVNVAMTGPSTGGTFSAQIPAQPAGTPVTFSIAATDSAAGVTTSASNSYTVATAAPVLAVTPATTLASSGTAGSGSFSPVSIAYTLTNSGTGTMSWTTSKTQTWLNLSATGGTLAAGANTTVTASINVANANALSANTYNDTITFTNTTNSSGNTTRAASLLLTNGAPTAPNPPVITALSAFSAGKSKTVAWPAVATATGYTLQIASSADFTTNLLSSQTVSTPYGTFTNLADGVTYFYRVLATNSVGPSAYSNTVSTTQDTGAPTVAITSPASGTSTATSTLTVTGTASDTRSGILGVTVNNVAATSTSGNFATWTATIPLGFGTNAITATASDGAGNLTNSSAIIATLTTAQTYNPLIIPDAMNGTTFNLHLYQTNKRFPTWTATNPSLGLNSSATLGAAPGTTTLGYNGALMWGPTLIMNKGDTVQMNVTNHLDQSSSTLLRSTTTTVHWHGFHIPAIMDGGPRQVIPAGTTWSPTFEVKNDAATFWYHPHLHMATQEQLTLGAGGMIIVRDPAEAALGLPRTYGVDDIPLAVTTRRLLSGNNEFSANQYVQGDGSTSSTDNYGDYALVNGTMNPQISLPKQFVRLRILCADIQRGYRIGFSDNRNFYVIGNDQGLLNAPQLVSQLTMMIGERVEILVDLSNDTLGSSLDLMAWDNLGTAGALNGALGGFGGSESNTRPPNGASGPENAGLLCNSDFKLLHINVAAATANPVTSVPVTLANNIYLTAADATATRTINIANGNGGTPGFTFDGIAYSPTTNNFTIPLNAVEKWTFNGGQVFGHAIHIHDIKFKIVSRSVTQGGANTNQIFDTISNVPSLIGTKACANYESGWKDTLYVPRGESVSVVAKYDDFASPVNPYMLHCHMLNHEDGGLMGQFVVTSAATETLAVASVTRTGSNNLINFQFNTTNGSSFIVQYSPDMTTGSWVTIGTVTSDGTSAAFTELDSARLSQARGFYRAVIQSAVAPPVITSSATATATRGAAFSYQITATNSPAGYGAILIAGNTALPGGLSVNPATGVVSGIVPGTTTAGSYNISVSASNSGGTTHKTVVLTVQ